MHIHLKYQQRALSSVKVSSMDVQVKKKYTKTMIPNIGVKKWNIAPIYITLNHIIISLSWDIICVTKSILRHSYKKIRV